jgi:hypothetical protein
MRWGLLITPPGTAPSARPYAVLHEPQRKDGGRQTSKHKGRALVTFAVLAMISGTSSAHAQTVNLPPLKVEAAPLPSCVDVQVQGARSISYDCLNQQLKDDAGTADVGPHPFDVKDAAGNGAPTTVGTFSYTGTSIRMGNAFSHSAIPQRPPAPSFSNALVPTGAK